MDANNAAAQLTFRFAERADTPFVLRFIRELARYEQLEDQVVADAQTLEHELFDEHGAQVLFAEVPGEPSPWASPCSSTTSRPSWAGAVCILEDLYVRPEWRGPRHRPRDSA